MTGSRAVLRPAWVTILSALFLLLDAPAVDAQRADWDRAIETFSAILAEDVADDAVGGISAGVMVDGDLVWADAWGLADRETRELMLPSSVSRTGSISKSVTAVLMMILVDQGVIGLDEPVSQYFSEIDALQDRRPGAEDITFRHLASHTAGLIREPTWPESVVGPIEAWEDRILQSIPQTAYDSIPGARYQYSNIGFGILGLALARAAGRPFMDLVEEEIFAPLGMTGSSFVVEGAELDSRLAQGYTLRNGSVSGEASAREHAGRGYKVPNGGVYSTVADLGRFLGAVAGVPGLRILDESSREEMLRMQTPEDPGRGYGLGFSLIIDGDGNRLAAHGGSVAGYNAYMVVDPDSRVGVVLLRNYTGGRTNLGRVAQSLVSELRNVRR
ncbi:MAG: serine hydrolase [Gemmatimonadota bacterium]|nr:serine hydrolase [Gemmatimonadota bacterium]MDE3004603.1 serine hydrolase [Gemmatimonadota bacterium]MDE3014876.1 serine hydrolase [Gemmatimonadota bacterium]